MYYKSYQDPTSHAQDNEAAATFTHEKAHKFDKDVRNRKKELQDQT